MCIKLTLLMDLGKLVGEEKLAEAREAVFKAFVDMGERISTVAYRKPELGLCTIIYRNSIIRLRIEGNGIVEVKVLQGNTDTEYSSETLEGIVYNIIDAIANVLNTDQDNVLNAVDYVITPLDTVIGGIDT